MAGSSTIGAGELLDAADPLGDADRVGPAVDPDAGAPDEAAPREGCGSLGLAERCTVGVGVA